MSVRPARDADRSPPPRPFGRDHRRDGRGKTGSLPWRTVRRVAGRATSAPERLPDCRPPAPAPGSGSPAALPNDRADQPARDSDGSQLPPGVTFWRCARPCRVGQRQAMGTWRRPAPPARATPGACATRTASARSPHAREASRHIRRRRRRLNRIDDGSRSDADGRRSSRRSTRIDPAHAHADAARAAASDHDGAFPSAVEAPHGSTAATASSTACRVSAPSPGPVGRPMLL